MTQILVATLHGAHLLQAPHQCPEVGGLVGVLRLSGAGYANPELDKLLSDAQATVDQKQRQHLYAQAQKIIWDALGLYPFELLENYIYRKTLSGFTPTPSQLPSFKDVTVRG